MISQIIQIRIPSLGGKKSELSCVEEGFLFDKIFSEILTSLDISFVSDDLVSTFEEKTFFVTGGTPTSGVLFKNKEYPETLSSYFKSAFGIDVFFDGSGGECKKTHSSFFKGKNICVLQILKG